MNYEPLTQFHQITGKAGKLIQKTKRDQISQICKIDQGIDNSLTQDLVIFAVQFESIVEVEVLYYFEYRPKKSQFALYFV